MASEPTQPAFGTLLNLAHLGARGDAAYICSALDFIKQLAKADCVLVLEERHHEYCVIGVDNENFSHRKLLERMRIVGAPDQRVTHDPADLQRITIDFEPHLNHHASANDHTLSILHLQDASMFPTSIAFYTQGDFDWDHSTQTAIIACCHLHAGQMFRFEREMRQEHTNENFEERMATHTAELQLKNQQLEIFSYAVAHDLKAPLRGIDGYSRLLLEDYGHRLDETGQLFLQNVRTGVALMGQMVTDLLTYANIERRSLHLGPVDVDHITQALIPMYTPEIQARSVELLVQCNLTVYADQEGLKQAIRNLVDNAMKFTANTPQPRIDIGCEERESTQVIWVHDNGVGFDMKYHDQIFEVFQRLFLSEHYPGTGIGLALVRKAMERIGGRVWAESTVGNGATFYLEFRRHQ
jgi:signal transduction histidine kinase